MFFGNAEKLLSLHCIGMQIDFVPRQKHLSDFFMYGFSKGTIADCASPHWPHNCKIFDNRDPNILYLNV